MEMGFYFISRLLFFWFILINLILLKLISINLTN